MTGTVKSISRYQSDRGKVPTLREFLAQLSDLALVEEARARLTKQEVARIAGVKESAVDQWRGRNVRLDEKARRDLIEALETWWRRHHEEVRKLIG